MPVQSILKVVCIYSVAKLPITFLESSLRKTADMAYIFLNPRGSGTSKGFLPRSSVILRCCEAARFSDGSGSYYSSKNGQRYFLKSGSSLEDCASKSPFNPFLLFLQPCLQQMPDFRGKKTDLDPKSLENLQPLGWFFLEDRSESLFGFLRVGS